MAQLQDTEFKAGHGRGGLTVSIGSFRLGGVPWQTQAQNRETWKQLEDDFVLLEEAIGRVVL